MLVAADEFDRARSIVEVEVLGDVPVESGNISEVGLRGELEAIERSLNIGEESVLMGLLPLRSLLLGGGAGRIGAIGGIAKQNTGGEWTWEKKAEK